MIGHDRVPGDPTGNAIDDQAARGAAPGQGSSVLAVYFGRMRGRTARSATRRVRPSVVVLTWCAAFIGIFLISIPSLYPDLPVSTRLFLIGSFGASGALMYAAPLSDFAQPRNLLIGQAVAALVGVTAYKVLGAHIGVAAALAVATAIAIMQITHTLHPPAGATALIAVLGPASVHKLGYLFVLTPVLAGAMILLLVAVVMNNLSPQESRHYPVTWW
jgi:CBS-domain-containing membrane protein